MESSWDKSRCCFWNLLGPLFQFTASLTSITIGTTLLIIFQSFLQSLIFLYIDIFVLPDASISHYILIPAFYLLLWYLNDWALFARLEKSHKILALLFPQFSPIWLRKGHILNRYSCNASRLVIQCHKYLGILKDELLRENKDNEQRE